jgi:hypothetical protein
MTDTTKATPKLLWVVGLTALFFDGMGAFDFVKAQLQDVAWFESFDFTQEQIDYIFGYPMYIVVPWGIAVWSGFFGAVMLLMRKAIAFPLFAVALGGFVLTVIYNYAFGNAYELMGTMNAIMTGVIFFLSLGFTLYARSMKEKGVLS